MEGGEPSRIPRAPCTVRSRLYFGDRNARPGGPSRAGRMQGLTITRRISSCWRPVATSPCLHRYRNAGFDGRPQARAGRQRPVAPHQNHGDIWTLRRTRRRSPVRRGVPTKTLQLRPDFQRLTGANGAGLNNGPLASYRKKSASLLKPEALFLVFGMPRSAVRTPFGGPGDGRRRCPTFDHRL